MITLARRLIAIAITTRCFIPPLSSCGYLSATSGFSPTVASSSLIRASSAERDSVSPWSRNASANWRRTRVTGLREFMAPCATSAIAARRRARICLSGRAKRSTPSNNAWPLSIRPGGLIRRMSAIATVDFPDPDSPTNPSRSPARRSKLTLSTARTAPRDVW